MGYYTDFSLTLHDLEGKSIGDDKAEEILVKSKVLDRPEFNIIKDLVENGFCFNRKWYSFREDMKALSYLFPKYVFILRGHGEEPNDIWLHEYCGGEVETTYIEELKPTGKFFQVSHTKDCRTHKVGVCVKEIEFWPWGIRP